MSAPVQPYIPWAERVSRQTLALSKALHQIKAGCERWDCEVQHHEDDADALQAWLDEYDFRVEKGRR